MRGLHQLVDHPWPDTVDPLAEHGADDVIVPCGKITVATREHQLAELDASAEVLRSYGQSVRRYEQHEIVSRVASPTTTATGSPFGVLAAQRSRHRRCSWRRTRTDPYARAFASG